MRQRMKWGKGSVMMKMRAGWKELDMEGDKVVGK